MLLRVLAERIPEVTCDALPAQAVDIAKQGILDAVMNFASGTGLRDLARL
jgi:hypothetical protein